LYIESSVFTIRCTGAVDGTAISMHNTLIL